MLGIFDQSSGSMMPAAMPWPTAATSPSAASYVDRLALIAGTIDPLEMELSDACLMSAPGYLALNSAMVSFPIQPSYLRRTAVPVGGALAPPPLLDDPLLPPQAATRALMA